MKSTLLLATLLMTVAALFTEVNLSSGEREDRANRWVLPAFGVIGIASGFLPAYTDRIDFWTFGGEGVRWLGTSIASLTQVQRALGKQHMQFVAVINNGDQHRRLMLIAVQYRAGCCGPLQ